MKLQDADLDENEGGEVLVITKADLFEVSVVPFPCNTAAQITRIEEDAA